MRLLLLYIGLLCNKLEVMELRPISPYLNAPASTFNNNTLHGYSKHGVHRHRHRHEHHGAISSRKHLKNEQSKQEKWNDELIRSLNYDDHYETDRGRISNSGPLTSTPTPEPNTSHNKTDIEEYDRIVYLKPKSKGKSSKKYENRMLLLRERNSAASTLYLQNLIILLVVSSFVNFY